MATLELVFTSMIAAGQSYIKLYIKLKRGRLTRTSRLGAFSGLVPPASSEMDSTEAVVSWMNFHLHLGTVHERMSDSNGKHTTMFRRIQRVGIHGLIIIV